MDAFDLPADMQVIPRENLWRHTAFVQGDDLIFHVDQDRQPPGTFTLTYQWARAGATPFSMVSAPNGEGGYDFNVPAATTTGYTPGMYRVQAYLTNVATGTRHTLGIQEGQIYASLATVSDPRSPNRIALDAVEAALANAAPGAHLVEYVVGGKTVKRKVEELIKARAYYAQRCRVEDGHPLTNFLYSL